MTFRIALSSVILIAFMDESLTLKLFEYQEFFNL